LLLVVKGSASDFGRSGVAKGRKEGRKKEKKKEETRNK
jgi:hypothetical protein